MTVRTAELLVSCLLAATLGLTTACGGDDEGTGGEGPGGGGPGGGGGTSGADCTDFSDVSGSPSFKDDVIPIFSLSCALSASCHQTPSGKEDLILGQAMADGPPDQSLIDQVHGLIVGADATESALPRVDAGNPSGSWLLLKMACGQEELTSHEPMCTGTCQPMPPPTGGLDAERVNTVAAWIASGAPNN